MWAFFFFEHRMIKLVVVAKIQQEDATFQGEAHEGSLALH